MITAENTLWSLNPLLQYCVISHNYKSPNTHWLQRSLPRCVSDLERSWRRAVVEHGSSRWTHRHPPPDCWTPGEKKERRSEQLYCQLKGEILIMCHSHDPLQNLMTQLQLEPREQILMKYQLGNFNWKLWLPLPVLLTMSVTPCGLVALYCINIGSGNGLSPV